MQRQISKYKSIRIPTSTLSSLRSFSSSSSNSGGGNNNKNDPNRYDPGNFVIHQDPTNCSSQQGNQQQQQFQQQNTQNSNPLSQMMGKMMQEQSQWKQNSGGGGAMFMNMMAQQMQQMMNPGGGNAMMDEVELTCWCGHKFRVPAWQKDSWVPAGRFQCQVPTCPQPNFFIDGEGAKMLDEGKGGTPLPSRPVGKDDSGK